MADDQAVECLPTEVVETSTTGAVDGQGSMEEQDGGKHDEEVTESNMHADSRDEPSPAEEPYQDSTEPAADVEGGHGHQEEKPAEDQAEKVETMPVEDDIGQQHGEDEREEVEGEGREDAVEDQGERKTEEDEADGDGEQQQKDSEEAKEPGTYWSLNKEGPRQRRSVQKLVVEDHRDSKAVEVKEGRGLKLSEMPDVVDAINKAKPPILKVLHSVAFGKPAKAADAKAHLLEFSGLVYPDGQAEAQRAKLVARVSKVSVADIKEACDICGVDRSGKTVKDDLVEALVSWLEGPSATGKKRRKTSAGKRKRSGSSTSRAIKKGAKKRTTKGTADKKVTRKRAQRDEDEDDEDEEESEVDMEESEEEQDDENDEDYEEDEAPRRKRARKGSTRKKTNAKGKKSKPQVDDEEEGGEEEDEDVIADSEVEEDGEKESENNNEEEAAGEPDELERTVRKIVSKCDPDNITIKQVMTLVSAELGRDVSDEKPRIKGIVAEVLSS